MFTTFLNNDVAKRGSLQQEDDDDGRAVKRSGSAGLVANAKARYESDSKFELSTTLEKLGLSSAIDNKTESMSDMESLKTTIKSSSGSGQALPASDLARIHLRHLFIRDQIETTLNLLNQKFAIMQKIAYRMLRICCGWIQN